MVEKSIHPRDPRGGDLDVQEEVIGHRKGVNEQIIHRDLVRQIPLPDVAVEDGRHVNEEEVDEEVMEIQHRRQGR